MFNLGFSELVLLAIIALVFIGPKQLPEVAKTVARLLNEFRRATGDIVGTVRDVGEKASQEVRRTQDSMMAKMKDSDLNHDPGINQDYISHEHDDEQHDLDDVDEKTNSGIDVATQEYIETEVTNVNFDATKAEGRRKTDNQ